MDRDLMEKMNAEFSHMAALIITYDLDVEKIRYIMNRLEGIKCKYTNNKLCKDNIINYLRAYLICPDSKMGWYFREICISNGLTSTLDDLLFEYCNAKTN